MCRVYKNDHIPAGWRTLPNVLQMYVAQISSKLLGLRMRMWGSRKMCNLSITARSGRTGIWTHNWLQTYASLPLKPEWHQCVKRVEMRILPQNNLTWKPSVKPSAMERTPSFLHIVPVRWKIRAAFWNKIILLSDSAAERISLTPFPAFLLFTITQENLNRFILGT